VDRIRSGRLVSLVGPGGVGKTRLAIDVARTLAEEHRGGAVVVDLTSVRAADDVGAAVAHALRVSTDRREIGDALADAGNHDQLVVVDNCEHVIDAAAKAVRLMLEGGANLRVLTTSREPLGIAGEHVVPISPLPFDAEGSAALTLFEERARMAAPSVDLDPKQTAAVVRRLDGLPIAIEMAAARLRTMTLAELETSLDSGISVLSSTRRDVDERQRTVRSLLAWSDVLLDEDEREIWWAVATFAGPVTAADVASMTGRPAAAETLRRLADQSLVAVEHRDDGTRFTVLELVRAYVREQEDATDSGRDLGRRHAAWVRHVVAEIDADLRTEREPAAVARFTDVFDEIRLAFHWSLSVDHDTTVALLASIVTVSRQVLRPELVTWARLATQTLDDGHPGLPTVRGVLATGLAYSGQLEAAREVGDLALGGHLHGTVVLTLLDSLGDVASYEGRLDEAIAYYDREHALASELGDATSLAVSLAGTAVAKAYQGRHDEAVRSLEGATSTSITGEGWLWYARGEALLERDPEIALASLDRAVECAVRAGNRFLTEVGLLSSSSVIARTGDPAVAAARFVDLLGLYSEAGDEKHLLTTLRNVVPLLVRMGHHRSAATLFGAVADHPLVPSFGPEAERLRAAAAECGRAMAAPAFERAVTEGRSLDLPAALATACDALTSAAPSEPPSVAEPVRTGDGDGDRDGGGDAEIDGARAPANATQRWVRQGAIWLLEYRGATASLPDAKGLHDLATLLAAPHTEVHALQLVGGVEVVGAADHVLDDAARAAYRRRVEQLREEIEWGRERGAERRVRQAEDELDALLAELSAGMSLGGRPRSTASSHERARSTVTNRIRDVLRKIDAVHPELGRHLRNAVRTGTWCSYRPEHDTTWIVSTT
jgi:predicted ATPase